MCDRVTGYDLDVSMWHEAADLANNAVDDIKKQGLEPNPDQKIAFAQVYATLSVAQELSRMISDVGLTVRVDDVTPAERRAQSHSE